MTAVIENLAGTGSCEACDDTGLVSAPALTFDGRVYPHWAEPCAFCEIGEAQRLRIASLRVSWRYRESGVAA
jgi:hypothetical protein